jgi:CshA-type fibril repeat protein
MGAVVTPDQASSLYATANGDAVPRETPIPTVTSGTRVPDDGVTLGPALSTQSAGSSYSINVALAGVEHEAYLCAWIDFNQDEIFNPSERACAPNPQTGATSATITWTVPADIAAGLTYARVRLSYDPLPLPSGKVGSGEVEDYSLNIAAVVTPTATNDTSTGPHDTDQIITILANDVPVTGRTYVASTVELCTTNAGGQNLQCSKDPLVVADVGTYSVNNNGTVTFDPLPTFSGTAPAVTYQVEDSTGAEVTATIIVTVLPPIAATPEVLQVIPGGTIVYNNITGDTPLATGTNLNTSLTCLINPATLACDADDTFVILGEGTWTLDRATGLATFVAFGTITPGTKTAVTYQVTDAIGQTARSTLTPIVPPPPDAANDISSDAYDVTQTISPLLNDTAGTGATLVATSVKLCDPFSSPVQVPNGCTLSTLNVSGVGLYTVNSDGTVTFNPDETFAGTATPVTYQMADSTGQIDSATITVTVTPPPINATPQVKTLLPGASTTYTNITGTSSLATGTQLDTSKTCLVDPSTLDCGISVTIPFEGTWTLDRPSGVATFASLPGITAGVKTPVTYKVTDIVGQTATSTLTPIIPPPPGAYNDVSSGPYDTNQVISPLLNDSPGSGATLVLASLKLCQVDDPATSPANEAQQPNNCTATTVVVPGQGVYTLNEDGTVTFNPDDTFTGPATPLRYQVADSSGQIVTATITPSVTPPPAPTATDDVSSGLFDTNQTIPVQSNDTAGTGSALVASTLKLCQVDDPATSPANEAQSPNNCTAISVTIPGEGTYSVVNGTVVFDPLSTFTGTVQTPVVYQIADKTGQIDSATITPTVVPPPTATNDTSSDLFNVTQTISPLTNDAPGAGNTLVPSTLKLCDPTTTPAQTPNTCSATTVTIPNVGVYTVVNGTVVFNPDDTYSGTPQALTYQVADTSTQITSATISVTVAPPVLPDAKNDVSTGAYNINQIISPLANDVPGSVPFVSSTLKLCQVDDPTTSPANEAQAPDDCTATSVTIPGEGTYTVNANGTVTFDPADTFRGTVQTPVTYQVADTLGNIDSATITPTVTPPPPPSALPETQTVIPGGTATFNNITGDTPLASGVSLDVSKTCLIDPATLLCDPNDEVVIIGEGTWTLNRSTGVATFTAFGTISDGTKTPITYKVTDITGQTATSTLTPIVPPPPDAKNDTKTGPYDTNQTINILTNDIDSTGDAIDPDSTVTLCDTTQVAPACDKTTVTTSEGTYTLVDGVVTFDPLPSFSGTATAPVTYVVTDSTGQKDSALITPTVGLPNPPVANPDTESLIPGATATFNNITGTTPLATGTDLNASLTCLINPATLACDADNTFVILGEGTWTLNPSTGVATFTADETVTPGTKTPVTYQVTDAFGQTATSTLTPTILPPPDATNDTNTGPYDTVQLINLVDNDTPGSGTLNIASIALCDPNTTPAQIPDLCEATNITIAGEGSYTLNPDGTVTFDPLPTFTGSVTRPITYQIEDSTGQYDSATITPTVLKPPAPVATPEVLTVIPTGTITYNNLTGVTPLGTGTLLQANATCLIDPATLACDTNNTFTILGEGTWTLNPATQEVTFVAEATIAAGTRTAVTYQITDAFGQTATSTLTPIVPPPPGTYDDVSTGAWDTNQTITPLTNDLPGSSNSPFVASTLRLCGADDPDTAAIDESTPNNCEALTLTVAGQGTYTVNADGTVTFDPLSSFAGTATPITYQVSDTTGQTDSSTITPTVTPPPLPIATPDTETVIPGATATFNNITGTAPLATGTLLDATKTCLVNPATNACGTTVTILNEGTYTLDPTTGVVTFVALSTITPGTKTSVTYRVTDVTGQTASSTLTPNVPPPPSSTNDVSSGAWNTDQTISILTNDVDSNGSPIASTAVVKLCAANQVPNNCAETSVTTSEGVYSLVNGVVTFDPDPTFSGTVKVPVTYQVTDSTGQIDSAIITPTVALPPVPVATPEVKTLLPGASTTFDNITTSGVANDSQLADGTMLQTAKTCIVDPATTICGTTVTIPNEGTFTLNQTTGVVTFQSEAGIAPGTKTPITYQVTDVVGQTASSTLTPIIPPPPDAKNDVSSGAYDTNQTITILTNDLDSTGAPIASTAVVKLCASNQVPNNCAETTVTTSEGVYSLVNGVVTFDPDPTFSGTAKFPVTYQVTDSTGQIDSATITPTVTPPPVPVATPEVKTLLPGTSTTFNNITGDTPLATGTLLQTSQTCLINPATQLCDTDNAIVILGEGTWTLDRATGIATFAAFSTITPGTKTAVTYQVTDAFGQTASSTLTPIIPSPPDAKNDVSSGAYDTNQTITILTNDLDSTGAPIASTAVVKLCDSNEVPNSCTATTVTTSEGVYSLVNGVVTFDPEPTFSGTAQSPVTYQVTDSTGQIDSATITPTVTPPPVPVATPEVITLLPGETATYNNITGTTPLATGTLLDTTKTCFIDTATGLCIASDTITVAGEGTWTLDRSSGVATFVSLGTITPGTKTAVTYQVTDAFGQTATSTLTPIVPPPPEAEDDYNSGLYDTNQVINILTNDSPTTGETLVISSVKLCATNQTPNNCSADTVTTSEGTYSLVNGVVTFDPLPTFTGPTKFPVTYQVTDTSGQTASATINPTVGTPNQPVANPETLTVIPGGTATYNNLTGDTPLASGTLLQDSKTCLIDPATLACDTDNSITILGEGVWTLDPVSEVVTFVASTTVTSGTKTSVTYRVTDAFGQSATSTLTPIVPPPPDVKDDFNTDAYDTNQAIAILANDVNSNGSVFATNSTVLLCGTGETPNTCTKTTVTTSEGTYTVKVVNGVTVVEFDPVNTFTGTVQSPVTYQTTDATGQKDSALITPTVLPPAKPVATPDTELVIPGATATFNNITGDTPLATGTLLDATKTCIINPATNTCGTTVTILNEGTFTLDPTTGVVTFVAQSTITPGTKTPITYRVTDVTGQTATSTLTPIVPPPPSATDDVKTGPYDTNQIISILTNDVDSAGTVMASTSVVKLCSSLQTPNNCSAASVTVTNEGTYTLNADGTVTFDPLPTFTGTVKTPVTYQVTDSTGQIDSALITPTVIPPPPPVATPDTESVIPGATATFNNITGDTPLATGTLLDATKTCIINPATNICGTTVNIPNEGVFTLNPTTGVVTFVASSTITPGTKTPITYRVTDVTGQTATSTLTPIVPPPPDVKNDVNTDAYDTNQVISILTNDLASSSSESFVASTVKLCSTGQTPNNCTATSVTITGEGTYTVNANGTVTFDPLPTFTGTVKTSVTYQVTDTTGQTDFATITPTVLPPPAPTATDDFSVGPYNTSQTLVPISNDTPGADGAPLKIEPIKLCTAAETPVNCSATTVSVAGEGTYTVKPDGGVMFTPLPTFTKTATPVLYQTQDLLGRFVFATLNPAVMPPPPPDINDDLQTTAYDINQTYSPLVNDAPGVNTAPFVTTSMKLCQIDNPLTTGVNEAQQQPSCTASTVIVPGEGTYSITSTGVVVFDPLPTFTGTVATSVTYQVTDIAGQVGTATITPTITPPPLPVATPDTEPVLPGQTIAFNNITGSTPLATGTQLDATKTCIVDPATNICGVSVNIPNEGTFTLDPTTGVVSFVALNTITSGTKTSVTYKVTDITGQTATSTLTPIVPPPPSATDDYSSGPLDTNQTLTPFTNDAFTSDAPASNNSLKLCGTGETPNTCTKTSLTVSGEGVYTVNANGTVTFDPEPTFVGTATPVRYQATDVYNRPVTALLHPSVTAPSGPVATPETKLMTPGSTATFTNVVGANALATGSQLQTGPTNGPCLIDPATGICGTTVTIANEGTWTIDQSTGIATFASLATITPGTKTPVTYKVTDVLGRTATSTLTPIIPEPPTATNDAITDKYDTNQVYKPLDNDTFSSLSPVVLSTLKLCATGQLPNVCDATTFTIDGEGTYTVNTDGTVTFDPLPTFVGTATPVTYQVSNTLGQTVSATITPTVIPPPLPVANIDTGTTRQGKTIVFSPWLNDAAAQVSTSDTANLVMVARTLRLCPINMATKADVIVVPKANPACTLTKLTTKDGTYTVDTKTGKVTFVHKKGFFGTVTQPVTYQIATNWVGPFGNAHATSQIIPTIIPRRIPAASVGDKVWRDVNGDGYQNKKDRGIPGVKVTLLTINGKPVTDLFGNRVKPQLTNKDGKYRFDDLPAGQYMVRVKYPPKQRPTIAERPGRERNSSSRQAISRYLRLGQHDGSLDFGMVGPWLPGLPRTM